MKKIILLAVMALSITAVSCRKERTCECKTMATEVKIGFGEQTTVTYTSHKVTAEKQKKNRFKYSEGCYSKSYSYNDADGSGPTAWSSVTTVETTCDLK